MIVMVWVGLTEKVPLGLSAEGHAADPEVFERLVPRTVAVGYVTYGDDGTTHHCTQSNVPEYRHLTETPRILTASSNAAGEMCDRSPNAALGSEPSTTWIDVVQAKPS